MALCRALRRPHRRVLALVSCALCVLTLVSSYRAFHLHHISARYFHLEGVSYPSSLRRPEALRAQPPPDTDHSLDTPPDASGPIISYLLHNRNKTFLLPTLSLSDYISSRSGKRCLTEGTQRETETGRPEQNQTAPDCECTAGWHGPHCAVPTTVHHSNLASRGRLSLRARPRRLINAININHELDLLHARFHELASVVDLFLVCESNYTAYGSQKPLLFLDRILRGEFDYVRERILYVYLDHFPTGGRRNGWLADDYLRTFLSRDGMARVLGSRHDDVFVVNDADEIPARQGLLFLKLHDGWTEPFGFHLRKSLYGFFWREPGTLDVRSGCSLAMFQEVYHGDAILLRRKNHYHLPGHRAYQNRTGVLLLPWSVGSPVHYAGWHCSWCFTLQGIRHKLLSAQNGDFPRWGDYEEKTELGYIRELVRTGGWFDGSVGRWPHTDPTDRMYAPAFLLRNFQRFRYLLENPYANHTGTESEEKKERLILQV